MRSSYILIFSFLLTLFTNSVLLASQASRDALGDPSLVLEEDSTVSSILNYGNPAGLAFLSTKTRVDMSISSTYTLGREKFTTSGDTCTVVEGYDAEGNTIYGTAAVTHITAAGVTLPANTTYVRDGYWNKSYFNNIKNYTLSGYIFNPVEKTTLQLIPLSTYQRLAPDEDLTPYRNLSGGLIAKAAYLLNSDLAIGAGIGYQYAKDDGWSDVILSSIFNASLINQQTDGDQLSSQIGLSQRLHALFDENDTLDLGLLIQADRSIQTGDYTFDGSASLTEDPVANVTNETIPWSATLQSLYHYKNLMDIALEIGYEESKDYYEWSSDYFADQDSFGYSTHYNVFYELAFRARLPMVRDDDLRFGVSFNNKGIGNTYPTGKLRLDLPNTVANIPEINTSSSTIAIETAAVPIKGSVFALKYKLGSSNSYQSGDFIDDVGYTDFTFSSQYTFWDHVVFRLSYSNIRLATEYTQSKQVFTEETGIIRFGTGYTGKHFDIDLYAGVFRKLYKPVTNTSYMDVYEQGLEGTLSFIYHY